jgi:hypothetical protein
LHLHWPKVKARFLKEGNSLKGLKEKGQKFILFPLGFDVFFSVIIINKA